ncbi:MAG TPA: hypothetical protein VFR61_02190 [Nitrososphaeraceae archaeon]|nr:hypothetical protein [Nitrososphaeraceae archaeon]
MLHDIHNDGKIQRYLLQGGILKYFRPAMRKSGFVSKKGSAGEVTAHFA